MFVSTPDTQLHDMTPDDLSGLQVDAGAGAAAALNWFLGPWPATAPYPAEAEINAADVIAAYQFHWGAGTIYARGDAATQANAYINQNDPGVNDASVGVLPGWTSTDGMIFDGIATYLTTPIVIPGPGHTVLCELSDVPPPSGLKYFFGGYSASGANFSIGNYSNGSVVFYMNGRYTFVSPIINSGNVGMAGQQGYRNGVIDGAAILSWTGVNSMSQYIGCVHNSVGNPSYFTESHMKSLVYYNKIITANQLANIAWAMGKISGRVP